MSSTTQLQNISRKYWKTSSSFKNIYILFININNLFTLIHNEKKIKKCYWQGLNKDQQLAFIFLVVFFIGCICKTTYGVHTMFWIWRTHVRTDVSACVLHLTLDSRTWRMLFCTWFCSCVQSYLLHVCCYHIAMHLCWLVWLD